MIVFPSLIEPLPAPPGQTSQGFLFGKSEVMRGGYGMVLHRNATPGNAVMGRFLPAGRDITPWTCSPGTSGMRAGLISGTATLSVFGAVSIPVRDGRGFVFYDSIWVFPDGK